MCASRRQHLSGATRNLFDNFSHHGGTEPPGSNVEVATPTDRPADPAVLAQLASDSPPDRPREHRTPRHQRKLAAIVDHRKTARRQVDAPPDDTTDANFPSCIGRKSRPVSRAIAAATRRSSRRSSTAVRIRPAHQSLAVLRCQSLIHEPRAPQRSPADLASRTPHRERHEPARQARGRAMLPRHDPPTVRSEAATAARSRPVGVARPQCLMSPRSLKEVRRVLTRSRRAPARLRPSCAELFPGGGHGSVRTAPTPRLRRPNEVRCCIGRHSPPDIGNPAIRFACGCRARTDPDDRAVGQRVDLCALADVDIMRAPVDTIDNQIMTVVKLVGEAACDQPSG